MTGLVLASLLAHAPALAADSAAPEVETVKVEGCPVRLQLPKPRRGEPGWEYRTNPTAEQKIQLARPGQRPPKIGIGGEENFQPDLARTSDAGIRNLLKETVPGTGEVPETITVAHTHHDKLGDLVIASYTVPGADKAPDLDFRVALLPVEAGFAWFVGADLAGSEALEPGLDEVLGISAVPRPAVPDGEFQTGHFASPAGYELDLPEGWRALTESEMGLLSTERITDGPFRGKPVHQVFVDPRPERGDLADVPWITCAATGTEDAPLEVMHEDRSPAHAEVYRARARAFLRKASLTDAKGKRISLSRVDPTGGIPIEVPKGEPGELSYLSVGDREGYLWKGTATFMDKPVRVATFYTTWDNVSLDCATMAREGDDTTLDLFERAMASLRVTDAANHPEQLTLMSKYKRWWPYSQPWLQLYWLPIPLFLIGVFVAMRGE